MEALLKRRTEGSLTVEASLIVPTAIFLVIAVMYLFFYQHDRAILQSYAYDAGETVLYDEDGESADQSEASRRMVMMGISECSESSEGSTLTQKLLGLIGSWKKEKVHLSGNISIRIPGTAVFTGSHMEAETDGISLRISYVDDWMKKHVLVN